MAKKEEVKLSLKEEADLVKAELKSALKTIASLKAELKAKDTPIPARNVRTGAAPKPAVYKKPEQKNVKY